MKVVVSILTVMFGLLLIDQTTSAQILDFKAEHIGDSKDVSIRFYIGKPVENISLEFSISLDGGKTYQSTVTTFQSENHPSNGVRQGENFFIWRAGIDIPDTYVDPSFLKMAISMTTRSDLQLEFLTDTKTPTIKITAPTPVFEVVQFIAGKVYGKAYSSLTDMVRPGTYSKSTITELLRSFDPNVWSPPGAKDTEINIAGTQPPINAYSQLENTLGVNFDPRSYFGTGDEKFGAREFTYDGNRDAQISPVGRKPIDIDASVIEKPSNGNDLIEAESPVPGRSIAFNFLAFRDNVTLANVMTMDHGLQLNISRLLPKLPEDPMSEEKLNELNPDYEWFPTQDWRPRDSWLEPGGANFDEIFGLVWNRGDWIVGFFNANGIYDIGYIPNPEVKIAHDEKGNHKIFENEVVSLGSESQMGDSFTGVKIWKVEISNRDMPLLALERFEKDFGQFLNLRKSFPASQLLKNSRPLNSQTEAEIVADNATDDLIRNYEESKGNNDTQPGNLEGERTPSPNEIIDDIDSTLPGFEGFTDFSQIPGSLVEENLDNLFEQAIDRLRSQEATVSEDEVNEVIQMRNKIEARSRFKPANPSTSPTTYYKIWDSGSANARYNIMVTGDGYANNETDRAEIWSFINEKILDGFCKADIQPSYLNAVNIYYLDAKSAQSGITQSAVTLIPKTNIFAALDALLDPLYLYSESNRLDSSQWRFYHAVGSKRSTAWHFAATDWEACWRVPLPGANTWSSLDAYARAVLGSQCDEIWVVQKDGQGACATTKNGRRVVTIADTRSASTLLHEWGHSFARLGDEYIASGSGSTVFSGSDSDRNILAASSWDESTRASLPGQWKKYVPGWRPLPTIESDVGTEDQDVGAFEGAKYVGKGVYRPVFDGRMDSNSPLNSPIGMEEIRKKASNFRLDDMRKHITLDADGDGKTDILLLDRRQYGLFLSQERDVGVDDPITGTGTRIENGVLEPSWFGHDDLSTGSVKWPMRSGDIVLGGDFTGDGRDDLICFHKGANKRLGVLRSEGDHFVLLRRINTSIISWTFRDNDKIALKDFDGDGKVELFIFNGKDTANPRLGIWDITSGGGFSLRHKSTQYFFGGYEMGENEKFQFPDLNGDGKIDIVAINQNNWTKVHIQSVRDVATISPIRLDRFYGQIDRGIKWNINRKDRYIFGDWDGDGTDDLAIFNGQTWTTRYLGLFKSGSLGFIGGSYKLLDTALPGYTLMPNDVPRRFDKNGDGIDDILFFNRTLPGIQIMAVVGNDGSGNLSANWQSDWIGGWNLGSGDKIDIVDFRGSLGWDDLFIYNENWFGLLRGRNNYFSLESIYYRWIQNLRYHSSNLY